GTVQQHTEDAFLASRADQRCKKETYERPPAGVLEFNLQILHRAFRLQLLKEDGPFFPGLPEAEIDSSFSDDMVRRQFQELQQVFIYVEEYSLQGNNGATHGTVPIYGGKPLLRMPQSHLA